MSRLTGAGQRAPTSSQDRLVWVDVAKGASIVLVVLNHAVAALAQNGWGLDSIRHVDAALTTFRMPLFFFASGMFFAKNLQTQWTEFLRYKVGNYLYLYGLWSVHLGIFFWVFPWEPPVVGPWQDIILSPLLPASHLWFIYALPLYFLATRALSRFPMPAQAAVVSLVTVIFGSGFLVTGSWAWDAMLTYFAFFFVAVHFRTVAMKIAERSSWRLMLGCGLAWAGLIAASYLADMPVVSPLRMPLSVLALVGGIILASKLASTWLGERLRNLGLRTLPVYLLHMIVTYGAAEVLPHGSWIPAILVHVAPFLITALGVAIPLAFWRFTRGAPGLYSAPWARPRTSPSSTAPSPT